LSQAVDGIRYATVTGVQTCALPISGSSSRISSGRSAPSFRPVQNLDEAVRRRGQPVVLVREVVSVVSDSVVLLDEGVIGCDEAVVLMTQSLDPARGASLCTPGQ